MQRAQTRGNCQNTVQASPAANASTAANAQLVSYDQRAVNDASSQSTQATENDHNPEQDPIVEECRRRIFDDEWRRNGVRFDDDQADPYE